MKAPHHYFLSTSLAAILGRSAGLAVPFFIGHWFGATPETDAFFLAYGIIFSLAGVFNPIFESFLVSYLAEHKQSPKKISQLSNGILILSFPLMMGLFFAIWGILKWGIGAMSGLDPAAARAVPRLYLEMLPLFLFGIWISKSNSIFYTHKHFLFPAFSPFLRSVSVIGFASLVYASWGVHALTVGYGLGEICRWAAGIFLLLRFSFWTAAVDWKETRHLLREFFLKASLQALALFAMGLIPLTDKWFASWLSKGDLSLISYADRLFQIPYQIFLMGILQVYLSFWAESYHKDSPLGFWKKAKKDIKGTVAAAFVFSIFLFWARHFIVGSLFGTGRLTEDQRVSLSDLFGWLAVGFAPAVINLLYARVLFVLKESYLFFVHAWLKLGLNIFFNFVLMKYFGLNGIALSTTVVSCLMALWFHFAIRRYWRKGIWALRRGPAEQPFPLSPP